MPPGAGAPATIAIAMTSSTGERGRDPAGAVLPAIRTVLCDLDGVVWLSHRPIPGAAAAIDTIRASGRRVLFVTNNSVSAEARVVAALGAIGIAADGDVVTSAMAAAGLLAAGTRALVVGGEGIVEAVTRRGVTAVIDDGPSPAGGVDAVVVGLDRGFHYGRLARASAAIRAGARFIATNDDATFPTPDGLQPGGGAIVAAVATASGVVPTIAGKPHRPMADLIVERLGAEGSDARSMLMVGDRPSTDGRFAEALGCPFALVRTGVTSGDAPPRGRVDLDLADLAELATALGSHPVRRDTLE
jgi:4-nitrophenyl phosphatase